jgi:hypothetical protein
LLQPAGDRAFGDGFAEFRELDFGGHGWGIFLSVVSERS